MANAAWRSGNEVESNLPIRRPGEFRLHKKEGRRNGDLLALPMATQDQGACRTDLGGMGGIRPDVTLTRRPRGSSGPRDFFAKIPTKQNAGGRPASRPRGRSALL